MPDSLFGSSPLPYGLLALWLALPGIWLGAGALCEALAADRAVRRILQPAAALAAWIVAVQLASMAARSFWLGLPIGMILLSVAGLVFWFLRREDSSTGAPISATEPRFCRGMWLSMIVVTAPIAVMSLLGHFHDELSTNNGHMTWVAEFQNDYFPPPLLGYPHVPLRYHYGFDLLCAALTALTRLRSDTAIHIATIIGWAYCWCVLWLLGERLTGTRRGGLLTATATLLGGGLVVLMAPLALHRFANATTLLRCALGMYSVGEKLRMRTTVVDFFFQHPFSLGFPLAAATLLVVFASAENRSAWPRNLLLGLMLIALSLAQDILFVTFATTLAFTEIILARRWRFALVLIGAAAGAAACGGLLFTKVPDSPPTGLYLRFWFTEITDRLWPGRVLLWNLLTYIPLLPLAIVGARYIARPMRWPLLLLAGGCLLVPVFIGFEYMRPTF